LIVKQRTAYKVTTKRKHSDAVADNLLNMNFNPVAPNEVWAGDISYLKNSRRLDVFSHCHGFILTPNRWLAY
jgi:transposase InsO family protein